MEKIRLKITDPTTGKVLVTGDWPVPSLSEIKNSKTLTKEQKKRLVSLVKRHTDELKKHFNEDAHDIDSSWMFHEIVNDFFGFNFDDLLIGQTCNATGTTYTSKNNKSVYTNEKEKVFYNKVRNRVYVSTQIKDHDNDIQLGDL